MEIKEAKSIADSIHMTIVNFKPTATLQVYVRTKRKLLVSPVDQEKANSSNTMKGLR